MSSASHGSEEWVDEVAHRVFTLSGRPDLRTVDGLFRTPCPWSVYVSPDVRDTGYELHAIGIYEGAETEGASSADAPTVRVTVRPTTHPIVLFLMSYHRVLWDVRLDTGAAVHGICLGSYETSTVRCAAELTFVAPIPNAPRSHSFAAHEHGELDGPELIASLRKLTNLELETFQGEYRRDDFVVPPYLDDGTLARRVLTRHADLLRARTTTVREPFLRIENDRIVRRGTRDEPIPAPADAKSVAFCAADGRFYVNTNHDVFAIDENGSCEPMVPNVGETSWLGGVAYDARRRRIIVTTFWHAGDHLLYDPVARRWDTVPIERTAGGIYALVYDARRDVLICAGGAPFGCRLLELSPDFDEVRPLASGTDIPFPSMIGASIAAQLALVSEGLVVSYREDAFGLPAGPRPEHAFLVPLQHGETQLVDLETGTRFDPVADDCTSEIVRDGYEGSISVADLRRDTRTIVEQVARTNEPLLVNHRRGLHTMVVGYYLYHGQLASLDETTFPDWQTRLTTASREIAEDVTLSHQAVTGWPVANLSWTRQAADDFATLADSQQEMFRLRMRGGLWLGYLPMDGPFHGWHATPAVFGLRVIYRRRGSENVIGYLRVGARHTFGRLIDETKETPTSSGAS